MYKVITIGFLSISGLIIIIPFIWMLSTSFDMDAVVSIPFPPALIPRKFGVQNYINAFKILKLGRLYYNSFTLTTGVIAVSIISALLSGYSISKIKFRGGKIVLLIFLATIMIPQEATLIPLYILFNKIGMVNSYWAFYITALSYPFGTFLVKQYMDTLPDSLREAAVIDGAGSLKVFISIFLPLSGVIIATLAILQFLASWNNLLWPLILLNEQKKYTIQIGMALFKSSLGDIATGSGTAAYPAITMAGNVFSILPVLIVYLFLQKYIVQSIALSGIKQ